MAPQKMFKKEKKNTNVIHTDTYVHESEVGKAWVEEGVSSILMFSISIIKWE